MYSPIELVPFIQNRHLYLKNDNSEKKAFLKKIAGVFEEAFRGLRGDLEQVLGENDFIQSLERAVLFINEMDWNIREKKKLGYAVSGFFFYFIMKNKDWVEYKLSMRIEKVLSGSVSLLCQYYPAEHVLHEEAVLVWGEELLAPEIVFRDLREQLPGFSPKVLYHILSELSITNPKEVLDFVFEQISQNDFKELLIGKLVKKIVKDREQGEMKGKKLDCKVSKSEILHFLKEKNWLKYL